jgi:hypothetical protein
MLSEIPTFPYVLSEEIDDFFRDANKESADGDGRWKNRTEYRSRPLPPVQAENKWLTIIPRR